MPRRSNKVIFVPFCILCQSAKAMGLTEYYPAIVTPLVELLNDYNVNIVQMPCPEMLGEGLMREPHDISYYQRPDFERLCRELALAQTNIIEKFIADGFIAVGLIGIERSPSCSFGYVNKRGKLVVGNGVFMQALLELLNENETEIIPISLDIKELETTLRVIEGRIRMLDNG